MPQNIQYIILGVYPVHQEPHGGPCHPRVMSGTLNVLQVPPFLTPPSWHTSDWAINTKLSGYLPWGKKNIIHDVRNNHVLHVSGQEASTSSKYLPTWLPLLDTLLIEMSTQNFQGIFLGVKKHHSWRQEQPCPPCLWSETLNVLQVPPFLTHF